MHNLTLLCRRHHRLVHEGSIHVCRGTDGQVTFHQVNGRRIEPAPPLPAWRDAIMQAGDTGTHDALAPTVDRLARMGMVVDAHSSPCWDGTPFNLALVIDALLGRRQPDAN
jgi:hypothetical protein